MYIYRERENIITFTTLLHKKSTVYPKYPVAVAVILVGKDYLSFQSCKASKAEIGAGAFAFWVWRWKLEFALVCNLYMTFEYFKCEFPNVADGANVVPTLNDSNEWSGVTFPKEVQSSPGYKPEWSFQCNGPTWENQRVASLFFIVTWDLKWLEPAIGSRISKPR